MHLCSLTSTLITRCRQLGGGGLNKQPATSLPPTTRVEWYSTFWRLSKTGPKLPIKYIFMIPIPENRQRFHLKKTQRPYKWINFLTFANTLTLILLLKIIDKKKIWNSVGLKFFRSPTIGIYWFCLWWMQKQFFCFSSVFAFKMWSKKFCLLILRLQSN